MLHRKVQALGDNTVLKPLYLQVTNGKLPLPLPYLSFCQCVTSQEPLNLLQNLHLRILQIFVDALMLGIIRVQVLEPWWWSHSWSLKHSTGTVWCRNGFYWVLSLWKLQDLEELNVWFCVTDVFTYLSQTLSLEEMCRVLPPGGENMYHNYVQICQQVGHANHIRALIMATGQQLLATLNLWPA